MPSGSKKRKSSKKKKKLGANNNNDNNNNNNPQVSSFAIAVNSQSHGKEDLKHGGKKETDGGDVSYSASQDHQFNDKEGTREKQLEIPHSESSIDNNKSNALEKGSNEVNKVAMVEGSGIVQVERELKLEGESMRNNIDIERVEPVRFPHEGGLRRRSSSSSKPAMSDDIVQVATSASDIDNVAFGSSEKENEKRELGVIDEKTRTSDVVVDTGLQKRDYEAVATSNAKPSKAVKDDDKLEIPYDVPAVDAGVRANNMEGSPHEHQPLVALDPRPVQTTSWKSCCGLFEVLAGSNK
ncbi:uncharacterized protein LOC125825992 [Solanum verrucosum]|uniref:uncharacterized protein LOC125825992 n=1 Tax=Solanum verrucosum TaxID=315347 RepID=UPI0020D0FDC7|nr:uncharacterized protein LOC125825992 [Solanum verrucosum]